MENDLYDVLGVSASAEGIVITAAYRALANRYHPDRWQGDPVFARTRMSEINYAYEVLSDPQKRKEYDAKRQRSNATGDPQLNDTDQEQAFAEALAEIQGRWTLACEFYSYLGKLRENLRRISHLIEFPFVVVLVETKRFDEAPKLAKAMVDEFLERFFGKSTVTKRLGRVLLATNRIEAATKLARAVYVLGNSTDPELIVSRIEHEFGLKLGDLELELSLREAEYPVRSSSLWPSAVKFARRKGFEIQAKGLGILQPQKHVVRSGGRLLATLDSEIAVVNWVIGNLVKDSNHK
jgi:curved DNA-binding protein CbpA